MAQNPRLEARRLVQEQLLRRREEAAAREARIREHALVATAAAVERQQVVKDTERRIGQALHALTQDLSVPEAAALCGLELREANRLRRLQQHHHRDPAHSPDSASLAPGI